MRAPICLGSEPAATAGRCAAGERGEACWAGGLRCIVCIVLCVRVRVLSVWVGAGCSET